MESSTIPPEFSPLSWDSLEVERAWYLLTVLLRIGRPCRPEEISAGCSLFSVPPETVIRSCFVRDSPLSLTGDFSVVPSWIATCALENFMAKVDNLCLWPRFRVMPPLNRRKRLSEENVRTYSRKRRCISLRVPTRVPFHSRNSKLDDFSKEQLQTDVRGPLLLASCFGNGLTPSAPKILGSDDAMQKEVLTMPRNELNVKPQTHISENAELMLSLFFESHVVLPNVRRDYHVECTTSKADMKETVNEAREQAVQLATHDCGKLGNTVRDIESSHTVSDIRLQEYKQVEAVCQAKTMQVTELERDGARLPTCPVSYCVDCSHTSKNLGELADMSENRARNPTHCEMSHGKAKNEHADTILCSMEREKRCKRAQTMAEFPDSLDGHPEGNSRPKCNDSEMIAEIPDSFDGQEGSARQNEACISRKLDGHHKQIAGSFAQPGNGAQESQLPKDEFIHLELAENESKPSDAPETMVPLIQRVANGPMDVTECTNKKPLCAEVQLRHEFIGENNVATPSKLGQINPDDKPKKQKRSRKDSIPIKNNGPDPTQKVTKNCPQPKELPTFEAFTVEEEEGSGGYGTVYRARRKHDGKIFAVKYPHPNAHMHHVNNELKMLERFGGRNFVIKYEGSFKSGNSECLVLEYVEHDRPEVLKKEIDMFELQWYGYCMFRALASLHKQGIVHRDVKPGNFLFSRRLSKGYLIDFNLAQDLHQKFSTGRNTKFSSDGKLRSVHHLPPIVKELPTTTFSAIASGRSLEKVRSLGASTKESSLLRETNKVKRTNSSQKKIFLDLCSKYRSQGADLSGVTPTKEGTSTRTSAERTRQPLPSQGRKELINMVQVAMQGPHHQLTTVPSSQRKRIPAPIGKMDREFIFLSPMPVHSNGFAVFGSAPLKSKGDGKHKREGPCVGTKGFRAPEVLFKSLHQGYKMDVWSAGVSLLYLMLGKAPFVGDPEQNLKDIAKLRGSEELWELAKLHNRDLSFPMDLLDIRAVPSMELREWCEQNSRRPDFVKRMPDSLFDLVDKCLTVNSRLRVDAEGALEHEFFASCREAIRKNRMRRRGLTSEATTSTIDSSSC